jgi:AcrR family transcriptional regulator
MRKVAEKIEYSPTAIYVHFDDKDDLFHELVHADFAKLASLFQSGAMPADPVERLREIGHRYIEFGMQFPNHYKLMFMTPHPPAELDERDHEVKGNPESDAYEFLRFTVQQGMAEGAFRPELTGADLVSQTLWAGVHGVISLQIAKCNDGWVDWRPMQERAETMLDVMLRGLLKEKELKEPK